MSSIKYIHITLVYIDILYIYRLHRSNPCASKKGPAFQCENGFYQPETCGSATCPRKLGAAAVALRRRAALALALRGRASGRPAWSAAWRPCTPPPATQHSLSAEKLHHSRLQKAHVPALQSKVCAGNTVCVEIPAQRHFCLTRLRLPCWWPPQRCICGGSTEGGERAGSKAGAVQGGDDSPGRRGGPGRRARSAPGRRRPRAAP